MSFEQMMKYGFDLNLNKKQTDKKDFKIKISDDFAGFIIGTKGGNIKKYNRNLDVLTVKNKRILNVKNCDTITLGILIQDSYIYNSRQ